MLEFTNYKPHSVELGDMAKVILFPLPARTGLVQSMVDDLLRVNGPAANVFWRDRIAGIVSDLRQSGVVDTEIRTEILSLQDAIQQELRNRAASTQSHGTVSA
ncbi:DUF6074 family protein [Corticibacterium sp. UT-5YL-CI-8]|nr:DUF6074 family protein [Tianweitania sp. UT-5YL-CI-8]